MGDILFVTQSTIGGTLSYFKLLIPRLKASGFQIDVVCPSSGPMKVDLEQMGINVIPLEMTREIKFWHDLKNVWQLFNILKHNKYSILHLHSSKAGAIGRLANLFYKIPCVYTPHGWAFIMDTGRLKRYIYILIERLLSKITDYVIAVSHSEKNLALKNKITNETKVVSIINGVDAESFNVVNIHKYSGDITAGENLSIVGMAGRLSEAKDPLAMVNIAKRILEIDPNFFFILLGDGELRSQVEAEVEKLNLKAHFYITGWVEDVRPYLNNIDIGILTSKWEAFGLVLAEYMAAGIPAVAFDINGVREVIENGETGVLIPPGNIEQFAQAVLNLARDKKNRDTLAVNGIERVKNKFNLDRVIMQHSSLYLNLMQ